MKRLSADVIIAGGGIMGASTALHLRLEHGRSVILLERGAIGSQASGVNFGNVRRQGRFLPQLPLANRSREIWGRLHALIGDSCEFAPTGHIKVAYTDSDMHQLETYARDAREYGLELELLGRNAVRSRYPWLGPDVIGASFSPHDGSANPRLVTPALARAARTMGASIHENAEIIEIERQPSGFWVRTSEGLEAHAPVLLNAAGAWAAKIAARFGEPVPLEVRGPQMAVTEPVPYFIGPVLGNREGSFYMRQIPRGNVIYGGGERGPAFADRRRAYVNPNNTIAQWRQLCRMIPSLEGINVIRVWSGIEGYMADAIPVMGPSRTTPGLFHAFGFSGHGFQLGPAVGAVMAELIATGRTSTPIEPFDIGRFKPVPAPERQGSG